MRQSSQISLGPAVTPKDRLWYPNVPMVLGQVIGHDHMTRLSWVCSLLEQGAGRWVDIDSALYWSASHLAVLWGCNVVWSVTLVSCSVINYVQWSTMLQFPKCFRLYCLYSQVRDWSGLFLGWVLQAASESFLQRQTLAVHWVPRTCQQCSHFCHANRGSHRSRAHQGKWNTSDQCDRV